MRLRSLVPFLAVGLSLALLASACSSSTNTQRSAASGAGDPTTLPALPSAAGTGERVPTYFGAVITPDSWVSSSLSPTLLVPGASGAWTFTLSDLSSGSSTFGPFVYRESGNSTRIPLGTGLQQSQVYTWTAESPGENPVGGSFMVDVQMAQSQEFDSVGGMSVGLSSGEAKTVWTSHAMNSLGGKVGFSLTFQASAPERLGAPAGWVLQGASSSEFSQIIQRGNGTVALISLNGLVSNYREGPAGTWSPVRLSSDSVDTTGSAPVLFHDSNGSWIVTSKQTTSVFVDDGNDGVANLVSVSGADAPVLGQTWTDGLLRKITDPVSGRSIEFTYGGGGCPKASKGFVDAPKGMVCKASFWDGSTSEVFYVPLTSSDGGVSIGRIVDYPEAKGNGASVIDYGYDQAGRIATVRLPIVASAAAADVIGVDDPQFWTSVSYDESGRVVSLTENAASNGAQRCTRSYAYESSSASTVTDSCFGGQVASVLFDPTTFLTRQLVNSAGQVSTYVWDYRNGQLLSKVESDGLATTTEYRDGKILSTRGPSKSLGADVQSARFSYDMVVDSQSDGIPMHGLDVTYWPSATEPGTGGVQELGPQQGGSLLPSLLVNWSASPAGNSADWSALMTGGLRVETAGIYGLRSSNNLARVRVNGVVCESGSCDALRLEAGTASIQVDVSSPRSEASMNIEWSGPDTGNSWQSIPTDRLTPQYGYTTTTTSFDPTAPLANQEAVSKVSYDKPATGQISARTTAMGSVSKLVYEQGAGGNGGWGRQSSSTLPGGNGYGYTYWGDTESSTPPCPGAKSVNQAGSPKESIAPGPDGGNGPVVTHWIDAAGRSQATQMSGGGGRSCNKFDAAGRVVSVELLGMGKTMKLTMAYSVDGNPLRSTSVEEIGDETLTSTVDVDLLGREIRSVDPNGVTALTTYDTRTGKVATVTTTVPGAAPTVLSQAYDHRGWLSQVSLNARVLATIAYNEDGTSKSIDYGNGVSSLNSYDDVNRLISVASTASNGIPYVSSRSVTAAGRVIAQNYQAGAATSSFSYGYDQASRLTSASVTAGLSAKALSWAYTYDKNSNRLSQDISTDGGANVSYTYEYDGADRLVSTTDPSASAGIRYDDRGNALEVGSDTLTYDAANNVTSIADGTVSVTYKRGVTGNIRARTITGGADAGTLVFGAEGVIFDGNGKALVQSISLPGGVTVVHPYADAVKATWTFTSTTGNNFFRTDDAGVPVGSAQLFDPFGQALSAPDPSQPGVPVTGFQGVTGNETVPLSLPVVMMGVRAYVPALGRFVELDPKIGGSANGYDFANQNPVNLSDPSGASADGDWIVSGIAMVLGAVASAVIPPAAGFWIGFAIGAVVGAVAYAAVWGIAQAATSGSQFDFVQFAISAGVGALTGGTFGRWRYSQGCKAARYLGVKEEALTISFVKTNAKELRFVANGIEDGGHKMLTVGPFQYKHVWGQYSPELITRTQNLMQINAVRDGVIAPDFLSRTSHLVRRANDAELIAQQRARDTEFFRGFESWMD